MKIFFLRKTARERRIRYYTLMVYEDADAVIITYFIFNGAGSIFWNPKNNLFKSPAVPVNVSLIEGYFVLQTLLRLFECFMESAPQLVLQIYILIRDPQAAKVRCLMNNEFNYYIIFDP